MKNLVLNLLVFGLIQSIYIKSVTAQSSSRRSDDALIETEGLEEYIGEAVVCTVTSLQNGRIALHCGENLEIESIGYHRYTHISILKAFNYIGEQLVRRFGFNLVNCSVRDFVNLGNIDRRNEDIPGNDHSYCFYQRNTR